MSAPSAISSRTCPASWLPSGVLLWELVETRDARACVRFTTLDGHDVGYGVGRVDGDAFAPECACDHSSPLSAWSCTTVERAENARALAAIDWSWWPCARLLAKARKILCAPLPRNPGGSPDSVTGGIRRIAVDSLLCMALGWTEHIEALEAEWAEDLVSDTPLLGEPWQWSHPIVENGALEPCLWRAEGVHCVCFRCSHSGIQHAREAATRAEMLAQQSLLGGA